LYFEDEIIKKMVENTWRELPNKYKGVHIDEYMIMPNHIHGIISIASSDDNDHTICVGANLCVRPHNNGPTHRSAPTLGEIVRWFKTMTTNYYIQGVKNNNWKSFEKKLWQRNYYDHVVRDDVELNKIREYIQNNPANWDNDLCHSVI